MEKQKKGYTSPDLKKWGTVTDLTLAGKTLPIVRDCKGGSNANQNCDPN